MTTMISEITRFHFDKDNIPGDGACFYHAVSKALFGNVDGRKLIQKIKEVWNDPNFDTIVVRNKMNSSFHFYNALWRHAALFDSDEIEVNEGKIRKKIEEYRKMYADPSQRAKVHANIGERMFGSFELHGKRVWAEDFTINIICVMLNINSMFFYKLR